MALWLDWNNDLLCLELPLTPGKNLDKTPLGKTDELIGVKRKLDLSENLNNTPLLKKSKIEEKGKMNKVKAWARILKTKKVLCIPHNLKRSEPTDLDRENFKEERQTKTDLKSLENEENGNDIYNTIFQIMRYDLPPLLSPIPDVDYYIEEDQVKSTIKKSVSKTEETKLKRSQPKKADEGRLKEKKKQKPELKKKTPEQKYDDDFFENVFQMAKYDLPELLTPIPELELPKQQKRTKEKLKQPAIRPVSSKHKKTDQKTPTNQIDNKWKEQNDEKLKQPAIKPVSSKLMKPDQKTVPKHIDNKWKEQNAEKLKQPAIKPVNSKLMKPDQKTVPKHIDNKWKEQNDFYKNLLNL